MTEGDDGIPGFMNRGNRVVVPETLEVQMRDGGIPDFVNGGVPVPQPERPGFVERVTGAVEAFHRTNDGQRYNEQGVRGGIDTNPQQPSLRERLNAARAALRGDDDGRGGRK